MKYAILWLILAVAFGFFLGSQNLPTYHRLAKTGVSENATVLELLPQMHDTVRYEYHVAGQTYQNRMGATLPNPPVDKLSVGQSVTIYYDPEYPEVSVLGDPNLMFNGEFVPVLLAAFTFPTFIVLVLARKAAKRKKVNPAAC